MLIQRKGYVFRTKMYDCVATCAEKSEEGQHIFACVKFVVFLFIDLHFHPTVHTHTHSPPHTLTHTLTLTHSHTRALSYTHSPCLAFSVSLSLSLCVCVCVCDQDQDKGQPFYYRVANAGLRWSKQAKQDAFGLVRLTR